MTIDERLDRLAVRHEALTQSVELLVHEQREWWEKNQRVHERNEQMQEKNQILIAQVLESIDSLARIAHAHEQRLSDLEGGRSS
jgi:hypothetical protein